MAVNKVVINNETKLDLTADTVDAAHLAKGFTAHDMKGESIVGTMESGGSSPSGDYVKYEFGETSQAITKIEAHGKAIYTLGTQIGYSNESYPCVFYSSIRNGDNIILDTDVTTLNVRGFLSGIINAPYENRVASMTNPSYIRLPDSIENFTSYGCFSYAEVKRVIFGSNIQKIYGNFVPVVKSEREWGKGNYYAVIYDFSSAKQVPILGGSTMFDYGTSYVLSSSGTYTTSSWEKATTTGQFCEIVVPDVLYDEWIAATNWIKYKKSIKKLSEVTA